MKQAYINLVISTGRRPYSYSHAIRLLKERGETAAYPPYGSLSNIEGSLFLDVFLEVRHQLRADTIYQAYSPREKLLAVFYTWLERLNAQRDFWQIIDKSQFLFACRPYMKQTKVPFQELMEEIVNEGLATGAIAARPFAQWYVKPLWAAAHFLVGFWLKDESPGQELTDAAVEKTVNFAFDAMQPGWLDSGFDLAKFIYQQG